jgi:hypothetical protein
MRAYLDVERASVLWYDNRPVKALLRLGRSFLRAPRFTVHLRQFWKRLSGPSRPRDRTSGWLRGAKPLNRGRCKIVGEALEVVTDPRSGGYSALLPLSAPDCPDKPLRLQCTLEVVDGAVGISAVTANCAILAERVAGKPGSHKLDIVVPVASDAAAILVRNSTVTGRSSHVRIASISAELCSITALPRITVPGPNLVLDLPIRSQGDPARDGMAEAPATAQISIDTRASAALVVDAWDTLGDRITGNITDKLVPALEALRRSGMCIVHLAHDHSVHPLARPRKGETVVPGEIMDTDYVADMFRAAGIKYLFYLGYHSNQCLLSRSLGVPAMQSLGFDTILVRDASAAQETSDSMPGEWFHRAAVHLVEINGAKTTTVADIQAAVATALARD